MVYLHFQGLACQKACRSNVDCPGDRACHESQCIDPCSISYCGANAECRTRDHVALCSCPPPLVGDPLQVNKSADQKVNK